MDSRRAPVLTAGGVLWLGSDARDHFARRVFQNKHPGHRAMKLQRLLLCAVALCAALVFDNDCQAGWPLGRAATRSHVSRSHVPRSHSEYTIVPTYEYMPRAYPYGRFGAQSYSPRTVHHDYNFYLRTWGPWPGH